MNPRVVPGVFIFITCTMAILIAGCLAPPVKEPTVSVSDIALSDVSLQTMTVNTTVIISNPNPVGAKLNKVAFDVYYFDDTGHFLGHGEQSDIDVKENGNTTVTIPVKIGNAQALQAMGSLVEKGFLTIRVNGSALIDLKVTSYEKPFVQSKVIQASEFTNLFPVTSFGGNNVNVTERMAQARGLWNALKGT